MEKIMVIDGDIRDLREMNDGLSNDFIVLNCSRGDKAFNLFSVYQPDTLILDPYTPGLNAKDLINRAKELIFPNRIPIMAVTHLTTLKHIEESLNWGVDIIFSKPFMAEKIRRKVRELMLRNKNLREQAPAIF